MTWSVEAWQTDVPATLAATAAATTEALVGLFILFVGGQGRRGGRRRLGQPGVVGELLGGFVVGPYALGLVVPGETAAGPVAEIGVVILLFSVGLEVRTDDLLAVGRPAVASAVLAMILPIVGGVAIAVGIGRDARTAAFVGLALAATSIGITSRVLADMGVLDRTFARVILGAAVIDDVLALILIGIVSGAANGDLSASTLLVAGGRHRPRRARVRGRAARSRPAARGLHLAALRRHAARPGVHPRCSRSPLVGELIGLAAIIGAFVAGLIVAETEARDELEHEIRRSASIFTPFFFARDRGRTRPGRPARPAASLMLVVALSVVGIVTKLAGRLPRRPGSGGWAPSRSASAWCPRGEVGIVVAGLGLTLGLLDDALFCAVLVAVVATTVAAPFMLARVVPAAARAELEAAPVSPANEPSS